MMSRRINTQYSSEDIKNAFKVGGGRGGNGVGLGGALGISEEA